MSECGLFWVGGSLFWVGVGGWGWVHCLIMPKSKFCMIMNVQTMYITFLHIYKKCTNFTKLVESLDQKPLETWNVCFLYIQTTYKLYKTYKTSSLKQPLYVFCTYKQCTNYTKFIQMLIKSYTLLPMYVFCI